MLEVYASRVRMSTPEATMNGSCGALRLPGFKLRDGIRDVSLTQVKPPLRTLAEVPPLRQRRGFDSEKSSDLPS
jgi:hypothetical protein